LSSAEIRQAFTKLLGEIPQAAWDIKTTIFEGDGLIRVQTVRYTLRPAG
jgi:hypothetical protein